MQLNWSDRTANTAVSSVELHRGQNPDLSRAVRKPFVGVKGRQTCLVPRASMRRAVDGEVDEVEADVLH